MPTIFTHAFVAAALGRAAVAEKVPLRFWLLTAGCSMLPDADVAAYAFDARPGAWWGHRGITHSIGFAALTGVIVTLLAFRRDPPFHRGLVMAYFAAATLTHPLLDMLTNGGPGCSILAPFTFDRFSLPWTPMEVSPIGLNFFGPRGFEVISSEFLWAWLPALAILGAAVAYRRLRH